jgi:Trypsin-like peptidase domain
MNHKSKNATARPKIPREIKRLVSQATFTFRTKKSGNGQCALIEGGLIITAAHCLDWSCSAMMAYQGEFYLETIATSRGDVIVSTLAVEPVSDLAVLGCPDDQALPTEAENFDAMCARITPLKLHQRPPVPFEPFPVWIRTHLKTWVPATATYYRGDASFSYDTGSRIIGGTSGGPIVNQAGELVGIVSNSTENLVAGAYCAAAPLLALALPAWVIQRASSQQP